MTTKKQGKSQRGMAGVAGRTKSNVLRRDRFRSVRRRLLALIFFDGRVDHRAAIQAFPGITDQEVVRQPLLDHQSFAFGTVHTATLAEMRAMEVPKISFQLFRRVGLLLGRRPVSSGSMSLSKKPIVCGRGYTEATVEEARGNRILAGGGTTARATLSLRIRHFNGRPAPSHRAGNGPCRRFGVRSWSDCSQSARWVEWTGPTGDPGALHDSRHWTGKSCRDQSRAGNRQAGHGGSLNNRATHRFERGYFSTLSPINAGPATRNLQGDSAGRQEYDHQESHRLGREPDPQSCAPAGSVCAGSAGVGRRRHLCAQSSKRRSRREPRRSRLDGTPRLSGGTGRDTGSGSRYHRRPP